MMQKPVQFTMALGLALLTLAGTMAGTLAGTLAGQSEATAALGKLPLYFVENHGVYPDAVRYYIQGADKTLFFTDRGITVALKGKDRGWTVKLDFVGANESARPVGRERQPAVFSYFTGAEKDWKAGLPTFSRIVYRDLWPGIDLVYNGTVNKLKYEFVVAPGADPQQIRLQYRGATSVTATDAGALRVATPEGSFEDAPPLAWQVIDGLRVPVEMAYSLAEDGAFGFTVGDYDGTKPLILDPAVIVYCGYIGGSSGEMGGSLGGVAVDRSGALYVVGDAASNRLAGFPARTGPDLSFNGLVDVMIAKLDPSGTTLLYCGYLGGASGDGGYAIAVDSAGNAYVTGATRSDQTSFPVKGGPDLTYNHASSGAWDAFVAKINTSGTGVVYCGYIGGASAEMGRGIAVDSAGCAYVTGFTQSTQTSFPVLVGPDLTHNGGGDVFIAKVKADGSGLDYCGYIGGVGQDNGHGVAVDSTGNVVLTGVTASDQNSFPVKVGPDLSHNGRTDVFVAKVDATGKGLHYCGYIGGINDEGGQGVALDATGDVYLTGNVSSDEKSFPVKVGPDLTRNSSSDAFVAKLARDGKSLAYCGYVGGKGIDSGRGIGVDAFGCAYVAGATRSDPSTFPVCVGPDLTYNGGTKFGNDAFIAKVSANGTRLVYCGYLGGAGDETAYGLCVTPAGEAFVAGGTNSDQTTFPVTRGPDLTFNGAKDAFVAKIALQDALTAVGTPRPGATVTFNFCVAEPQSHGLRYRAGTSFGTGPIRIGARALGLSPDDLLAISVGWLWPHVFGDYAGTIGFTGCATAKIVIPADKLLIGTTVHTAFVVIDMSAPQGIRSVSETRSLTIVQ